MKKIAALLGMMLSAHAVQAGDCRPMVTFMSVYCPPGCTTWNGEQYCESLGWHCPPGAECVIKITVDEFGNYLSHEAWCDNCPSYGNPGGDPQ
jgi:hypothetical protein